MTGTRAELYPHREHLPPVEPLLNVPKRSQATLPWFSTPPLVEAISSLTKKSNMSLFDKLTRITAR